MKTIEAVSSQTRKWVFVLMGFVLLLAGTVFGVDWANYFSGSSLLFPAIGKPLITLTAFVIMLLASKSWLEKRDWRLLLFAFLCMLPTDILMSLVVVSPSLSVGSWVFMVGGVLSIVAHIFLIIRVGRGLKYLKHFSWKDLWLPILIYGSAVVVLLILWKDVVRVGHGLIGPIYTAFFCTTMWFAWETVRRNLYPKLNAWMVAAAATCWYITEILGEIYNLGLGNVSEITFRLVWIFYGANVILWALSGFRWKSENQTHKAH